MFNKNYYTHVIFLAINLTEAARQRASTEMYNKICMVPLKTFATPLSCRLSCAHAAEQPRGLLQQAPGHQPCAAPSAVWDAWGVMRSVIKRRPSLCGCGFWNIGS